MALSRQQYLQAKLGFVLCDPGGAGGYTRFMGPDELPRWEHVVQVEVVSVGDRVKVKVLHGEEGRLSLGSFLAAGPEASSEQLNAAKLAFMRQAWAADGSTMREVPANRKWRRVLLLAYFLREHCDVEEFDQRLIGNGLQARIDRRTHRVCARREGRARRAPLARPAT